MWDLENKEGWMLRIDTFEQTCWRRFLRVLWIARRSNQWILKELKPEYSLEVLMLKLKLQYCGQLRRRVNSLEKTLFLGKIEAGGEGNNKGKMVGWHQWLNGHELEHALWDSEGQESLALLQSMGSQIFGNDWVTGWQQQQLWIFNKVSKVILSLWNVDHKLSFP